MPYDFLRNMIQRGAQDGFVPSPVQPSPDMYGKPVQRGPMLGINPPQRDAFPRKPPEGFVPGYQTQMRQPQRKLMQQQSANRLSQLAALAPFAQQRPANQFSPFFAQPQQSQYPAMPTNQFAPQYQGAVDNIQQEQQDIFSPRRSQFIPRRDWE